MHRRDFIKTSVQGLAASALGASWLDALAAPMPAMKITKVRFLRIADQPADVQPELQRRHG